MAKKWRKNVFGLIVLFFGALFFSIQSWAITYSEDVGGASSVGAWKWKSGIMRASLPLVNFGLVSGDDIDAISLGDDPHQFDPGRSDIFGVSSGAIGTGGDLAARAANGTAVERDIYEEGQSGKINAVLYADLISQSMGGGAADGALDGFDFGMLDLEDRVYFSLESGSPSLATWGWSAGDVLVCQYGVNASVKVFANATQLGSVSDIDALSIYDHAGDGVFDPIHDYIIYSTPVDTLVYHYGLGAPGNHEAHLYTDFGVAATDNITALEHLYTENNQGASIDESGIHIYETGWHLLGWIFPEPLPVSVFEGNNTLVLSLWAWKDKNWAVSLPGQDTQTYADSKGFDPLEAVEQGQGFWINAQQTGDIFYQSNTLDVETLQDFSNLLVATASNGTKQLNTVENLSTVQSALGLPVAATDVQGKTSAEIIQEVVLALKDQDFPCGEVSLELPSTIVFDFDGASDQCSGIDGTVKVTPQYANGTLGYQIEYIDASYTNCTINGLTQAQFSLNGTQMVAEHTFHQGFTLCDQAPDGSITIVYDPLTGQVTHVYGQSEGSFVVDDKSVSLDIVYDYDVQNGFSGNGTISIDQKVYDFEMEDMQFSYECGLPNSGYMIINGISLDFSNTTCENKQVEATVYGLTTTLSLEEAFAYLSTL